MSVKHIPFDEWFALNVSASDEIGECSNCKGEGELECFHCGSMYDCPDCDGEGDIGTYTIIETGREFASLTAVRSYYTELCKRTEAAMEAFRA